MIRATLVGLAALVLASCAPVADTHDTRGFDVLPVEAAPVEASAQAIAPQVVRLPTPTPSKSVDPRHYLTRLEWHTDADGMSYWRCPGGDCLGMVDLRSLEQAGQAGGTPQGYAWVTYDYAADICASGCKYQGVLIAGHNTDKASRSVTLALESRLGVTLTADTPHEMLAEMLTRNGDPTGETAWKPLLSDRIYLGGNEVWRAPAKWYEEGADPTWRELALGVKQEDYRNIREADLARKSDHYKRVLDKWSEDYGLEPESFVPSDVTFEGVLPHQTTITESFNTTDSDTLGPDLTWTEIIGDIDIVSNQAAIQSVAGGNEIAFARADTDLSSDDHYAQIVATGGNGTAYSGVAVRKDDTATQTWYSLIYRWDTVDSQMRKFVSGTPTTLASGFGAIAANDIVKLEVEGSTLTAYLNGVQDGQTTDTSITSNLRTMFGGRRVNGQTFDNFEASDGQDSPQPTPVPQRPRVWQAVLN